MRIQAYTYNGTQINDGTNYRTKIPLENPEQGSVDTVFVERPSNRPVYGGKVLKSSTLTIIIEMLGSANTQMDTLKALFDCEDETEHKFIIKDLDNSDKQWYVMATPINMLDYKARIVTVILAVADPVWKEETESTASWNITASGQTKTLTVNGNLYTKPTFVITPTSAGGTGFAYKKLALVYNRVASALNNYPLEITGGGLDTEALVTAGKMQADGDDLRVYVDGVETNRWLQDINTANTKVWITLDYGVKVEPALGLAIANTGAITEIYFTTGTVPLMDKMQRNKMVLIDSELFTYTGIDKTNRKLTGVTRAVKGTSMAAHTLNTTIRYIEHEIWMMYGNATIEAPITDDTKKPIILLTSTNTSWDYDEFYSVDSKRGGMWTPRLISSANRIDEVNKTNYYTGSQDAYAEPATEMGMALKAWKSGSTWRADNGSIEWKLNIPTGVTEITVAGYKYRHTATWGLTAVCQKAIKDNGWANAYSPETTPSAVDTWDAITHNNVALGNTYYYLRFYFAGAIGASAQNVAYHEITDVTLTLDANKVPYVNLGDEQNNYHLQAVIANSATSEWLKVDCRMVLNDSVTVNCADKTATLSDGTNVIAGISKSSRRLNWLNLVKGTNVLTFTDAGTNGVTVAISWRCRNS